MSLYINPGKVTAVLLADGWHDVADDSFDLDAYEYVEPVCGINVPAGYVIAKHPNWPDEWCCLNCMLDVVRQHQRTLLLEVPR
jgi:hypothetical protein